MQHNHNIKNPTILWFLCLVPWLPGWTSTVRAQEPSSVTTEGSFETEVFLGVRFCGRYLFLPESDPNNRFQLHRARLGLEILHLDFLKAEVDLDASEAPPLKDAFLDVRVFRFLKLRLGQYKKPFSRIRLLNPGQLQVFRRGISSNQITDTFGFGDRDLGLSVHGKLPLKLRYAFGVFNGNKTFSEIDSAKDLALRLEWRPSKSFQLGSNASRKGRNVTGVEYRHPGVWALGLDSRIRFSNMQLHLEFLWAQERTQSIERDWLAAIFMGYWPIEVSPGWELIPLIKAEVLDTDSHQAQDIAFSICLGVNLRIRHIFRIMLQAEAIEPQPLSPFPAEKLILLQMAFDFNTTIFKRSEE